MSLLIEKETGGYFSFVVDGNITEKVTNMRNDVLAIGNVCDFKTANGANIIKTQQILVTDITLIASGTFTFLDIETFLAKLIDVGFYDWLLGGGSGSGATRFDELIDTFGYFGKNGQVVRVNESQQKLETFTVYNYRNITDLEDVFSGIVPNKMLATSADGTKIELREIPESQQFLNAVGTFHYANTELPLTVVANVPKKLTNDALGQYSNATNAPYGVSSVWNSIDNDFNFNELSVGDIVHIRPDLNIDLVGTGTSYKVYMNMAIGSSSPWTLPMLNSERKSTDPFDDAHLIGFDIANEETRNFPAEIYLLTDANATVKVNGWYVEIIRKNINVVDIISDLGYVPENIDNKQNNLLPDGSGVKYPTVDAVNDALESLVHSISSIRHAGSGQTYVMPTGAIALKGWINDGVQHLQQTGFEADLNTFTQSGANVIFKKTITTGQRIIIDYYI